MLIEVKKDGDHKYCSQALWQLYQASKLLKLRRAVKLAVFGGPIRDPLMKQLLRQTGIKFIERGGATAPAAPPH